MTNPTNPIDSFKLVEARYCVTVSTFFGSILRPSPDTITPRNTVSVTLNWHFLMSTWRPASRNLMRILMCPCSNDKIGFASGIQAVYEYKACRVSNMQERLHMRKYSMRCCGCPFTSSGSYTVRRYSAGGSMVAQMSTKFQMSYVAVEEEVHMLEGKRRSSKRLRLRLTMRGSRTGRNICFFEDSVSTAGWQG